MIAAAVNSIGNIPYDVCVTEPTKKLGLEGIADRANSLIEKTIRENYGYLWLIELDVEVPRDAFEKLHSLNVDIALGYYPHHHNYNELIAGFLDETGKIWYLPKTAVKGVIVSGWVFAGAGCMLIKRRVFEDGLRFQYKPWTGQGQDINFMLDAQREGYIAKIHGDVECGHLPEWPLPKPASPKRFETLDVGCGDNPRGDVNCDHNVGQTNEGGIQTGPGIVIDPKTINNFVKCDAQFLPFRTGSFPRVVSYQVIEHVPDPQQMLAEMIRVSNGHGHIECPHASSRYADLPFHINIFEPSWFENVLRGVPGVKFNITMDEFQGAPNNITVRILKEELTGLE